MKARMDDDKPIIAIATGDPGGIGPEISIKAALDADVRAACRKCLVLGKWGRHLKTNRSGRQSG